VVAASQHEAAAAVTRSEADAVVQQGPVLAGSS
jgi:hypothetical protein